jgi:hypothetical protein
VGEERRERPVAELLRGVPQTPRHQVLAAHPRAVDVLPPFGPVVDVVLVLEPLQELLDRAVLRRAAARVEAIGEGPDRGLPLVPEHAQDLQLGVGHVLGASRHLVLRFPSGDVSDVSSVKLRRHV